MPPTDAKVSAAPADTTPSTTTSGSGRDVHLGENAVNAPAADFGDIPIGKVSDAINSSVGTPAPTEDAGAADAKIKPEDKKEAPITSLLQLRGYHAARGTAPSQAELDAVKQLEADILEQGSKIIMPSSEQQSKASTTSTK